MGNVVTSSFVSSAYTGSIQFSSIYCLPYILYKHITDLETALANINNNKH